MEAGKVSEGTERLVRTALYAVAVAASVWAVLPDTQRRLVRNEVARWEHRVRAWARPIGKPSWWHELAEEYGSE